MENSTKKDIVIKGYWLKDFMISLIVGFLSVIVINHYGNFSYWSYYDKYVLTYKSSFGSVIEKYGTGYNYAALEDFGYEEKLHFYITAAFKDYFYIFLFTGVIFILLAFFKKFKLKIN